MLHRVIGQASFYALLLWIDEELAEEVLRDAGQARDNSLEKHACDALR